MICSFPTKLNILGCASTPPLNLSDVPFQSLRNTDPSKSRIDVSILCREKCPSSFRPQVWSQAFLHIFKEQDNNLKPFSWHVPEEREKISTQKVCETAVNALHNLSCCCLVIKFLTWNVSRHGDGPAKGGHCSILPLFPSCAHRRRGQSGKH